MGINYIGGVTMKIWGVFLVIIALGNLSLAYFAAIDKIKPSKSTQIHYYIIVSISLLGYALREFSR
jgi:hypothetical protein